MHIILVNGKVFTLFESKSVELSSSIEHAVLQYVIQLEIWFYFILINIVLSLAHLL